MDDINQKLLADTWNTTPEIANQYFQATDSQPSNQEYSLATAKKHDWCSRESSPTQVRAKVEEMQNSQSDSAR